MDVSAVENGTNGIWNQGDNQSKKKKKKQPKNRNAERDTTAVEVAAHD